MASKAGRVGPETVSQMNPSFLNHHCQCCHSNEGITIQSTPSVSGSSVHLPRAMLKGRLDNVRPLMGPPTVASKEHWHGLYFSLIMAFNSNYTPLPNWETVTI